MVIEIYPAENAEFGWRAKDGNHEIIAVGGETYTRRDDAERAAENVIEEFKAFPDVPVFVHL